MQKFMTHFNLMWVGGSPGLVVMGGESCSEGRGFKSQNCLLDGHFFTYIVVKIVMFVWKDKKTIKEARDGKFKKKNFFLQNNLFIS